MSQTDPTFDITHDRELDVLTLIHQHDHVKQRDIARAIELSLGMTNAILKRLAAKGFIAMRKINSRNIHYLVTPDGVDLIARRSYRYLRRTVGHVVRYKERLLEVLTDAALPPPDGRGAQRVVLVGESDLEFLVEWCAEKAGMEFQHCPEVAEPPTLRNARPCFVVASERVPNESPPSDSEAGHPWDLHLSDLAVQA